jgi:DUF438 domain-containing protein
MRISEIRLENLFRFSQGIIKGEDGSKLIEKYGEVLKHMTTHDMIAMEERQLKMVITPQQIKEKIDVSSNILFMDNQERFLRIQNLLFQE